MSGQAKKRGISMQRKKQFRVNAMLALVLIIVLLVALIPAYVFATSAETPVERASAATGESSFSGEDR